MTPNFTALNLLAKKLANKQIKLTKDGIYNDYYYNVNDLNFIIIKQGTKYSIDCYQMDDRRMYDKKVDLGFYDDYSLTEIKEIIFSFLVITAANNALKVN